MRFFPGGFFPTTHFDSPSGDRIQKLYETRFDGSSLRLIESGSFDRQARIEAEAPFCDINYMLQRLSIGDHSVLNPDKPIYGDFSGLPSNPVDVINAMHTAESRFNQLSAEERKAFGNDYRVWLYSLMSSPPLLVSLVILLVLFLMQA